MSKEMEAIIEEALGVVRQVAEHPTALPEIAAFLAQLFAELEKVGFSREEAMTLLATMNPRKS